MKGLPGPASGIARADAVGLTPARPALSTFINNK
jgi:hypothetical protein